MKGKRKKARKPGIARGIRAVRQAHEEGETNPYLKAAILEVVENQLRENNPPETRQTLERLLAAGYSRQEAVEMIGSVVVEEIWGALKGDGEYDKGRFREKLEGLG